MAELKASISSEELTCWIAYFELEPFGPFRDDLRIGFLGARLGPMLAQFKGSPPPPSYYMPQFGNDKPKYDTDEQLFAKLMSITTKVQPRGEYRQPRSLTPGQNGIT